MTVRLALRRGPGGRATPGACWPPLWTSGPGLTRPLLGIPTQPVSASAAATRTAPIPSILIGLVIRVSVFVWRKLQRRTPKDTADRSWQGEPEAGALSGRAPHLEPAAVEGGVLERDGQAKAGSAGGALPGRI